MTGIIDFTEALEMQSKLQEEAYGKPLEDLSEAEVGPQTMLHVTALTDELHEVMAHTNWKPWKKSARVNRVLMREEMVDAFHFFMNLMLISGMDVEDLMVGYYEKHEINRERQKSGY